MNTLRALNNRKIKLESMLLVEKKRLHKINANIGFGAGMRRSKCTPSFARENRIIENLKNVTALINSHPDSQIINH